MVTVTLAMKDFSSYYQLRKGYASVMGDLPPNPNPGESTRATFSSDPEEIAAMEDLEVSFFEKVTDMGNVIRGLAGVTSGVISVISVVDAVNVGNELSSQIDQAKTSLQNYYTSIIGFAKTPSTPARS